MNARLRRGRARIRGGAAAMLGLVGWAPSAWPAEGTSVLLKAASDYVHRGYSMADGEPTLQGNVDFVDAGGRYLGAWVSRIHLGDARVEASPYAGLQFTPAAGIRAEIGLAGYLYDAPVYGTDWNYAEGFAQVHYRDLLTARVGLAVDWWGYGGLMPSFEIEAAYPLTDVIQLSGGIGYERTENLLDYDKVYWNFGANWAVHRRVTVDLRWYDSHKIGASGAAAHDDVARPITLSVSVGF
ncbi:MAG: TorF family putative porin [Gammaproteobacteria bacterium]